MAYATVDQFARLVHGERSRLIDELRSVRNVIEDDLPLEVRVRMDLPSEDDEGVSWEVLTGDPGWDTDHRGVITSGAVDTANTDEDIEDLVDTFIDDLVETYALMEDLF